MKLTIKFLGFSCLWSILFYTSCKKEYSCENCSSNKPPIAIAGSDQTIILPKDSVTLDGSASYDPDGTITTYLWTKIAGPALFNIKQPDSSETLLKNLRMGVYKFELTVTDNGGLSAKDTVLIIVNDPAINQPPVANAGIDQTIILPVDTTSLYGNLSFDPDGTITSYQWTKISGPSTFIIVNPSSAQTQIKNLTAGIYSFELIVTDNGGLTAKDTVKITADVMPISDCNISNRPVLNAQLLPVGNLSQARSLITVASAGNKILFAGGYNAGTVYSRVDIFDINTNTWSTAELSQARAFMATAVLGNKIFFAGGQNGIQPVAYDNVDIYDVTTNVWTVAHLSEARAHIAGGVVGNKVFFAGGGTNPPSYNANSKVDIYDLSSNTWSVASLSVARFDISATTVGSKIYFAGGEDDAQNNLTVIDVYDNNTNTWSTSALQALSDGLSGIAFNNKIYWAGLFKYNTGQNVSAGVEVRNLTTGITTSYCLSYTRYLPGAVLKDNNIVFFIGFNGITADQFDVLNTTTGAMSTGILPGQLVGTSIISVNNKIYVAGGNFNSSLSNQVWNLDY